MEDALFAARRKTSKVCAALALAGIGACSSASSGTVVPGPAVNGVPGANNAAQQFLYVSGGGGRTPSNVTVYRTGSLAFVRTITGHAGGALVLDSLSNLYAEDACCSDSTIWEYQAGTDKPLRTLGQGGFIVGIAVDSHGYLYLGNGSSVNVYAPNGNNVLHRIPVGGTINAVLIDKNDRMYVAHGYYGNGSVTVFDPGKRPGYPNRITQLAGVRSPKALALGPSGNLFVANDQHVYEFRAGSLGLVRTIGGLRSVSTIALDSVGRLYVASLPYTRKGYQPGWILEFEPGQTQPLRRITDGINGVSSIVTDRSDRLYAADEGAADITVYSPGGAKLLRTFKTGFGYPYYLAIGSK